MKSERNAKSDKAGTWRWLLPMFFLLSILSVCCVIAALAWDNRHYHTHGYSRLAPYPDVPYGPSMRVLQQIEAALAKRDETGWITWKWLPTEELARQTPAISLPDRQPYRGYGVSVLKSENMGQCFLYSPAKLIDQDRLVHIQHFLPASFEDEKSVFHARFAGIVMLCPLADRKDPDGKYYSCAEYPPSIKNQIPAKAWHEWCLIYDFEGEGSVRHVNSHTPPVPGCIVYIDQTNPENNGFYYPQELLPTLRAIYPDLRVPQEAILDTN